MPIIALWNEDKNLSIFIIIHTFLPYPPLTKFSSCTIEKEPLKS